MKTRVLDSWPILEWVKGREPVQAKVQSLLSEAENGRTALLMSAINVGEIYYFIRKGGNEEVAEFWRASSAALPLTIEVPDLDDI